MKLILKTLVIIAFFLFLTQRKKYDQKTCEEIYVGIAYFLKAADKHWKETKNEKKAAMYADTAANYTTIYNTFVNSHSKMDQFLYFNILSSALNIFIIVYAFSYNFFPKKWRNKVKQGTIIGLALIFVTRLPCFLG